MKELVHRKRISCANGTRIKNTGQYLNRMKPMWEIEVRKIVNLILIVARSTGKN
jgi:hypothetical protein